MTNDEMRVLPVVRDVDVLVVSGGPAGVGATLSHRRTAAALLC